MPISVSHSCSVTSWRGATRPAIPALFTSTSIRPSRSNSVRTIASTLARSATSVGTLSADRPAARRRSAASSPAPGSMSAITTAWPSLANTSAVAYPIPRAPPVMTATRHGSWLMVASARRDGAAAGDELPKTVPRVLVLAGGDHGEATDGGLELRVALVVVGRQALLDPLEAVRLERPRELDRVRDRECHVAIQLQGEFGAHRLARLPECVHVLAQPLVPLRRTVTARQLGGVKAHLLGQVGAHGGRIDGQAFLGLAAQQRVYRLTSELAQTVPDRQVHGPDGLDRQPFASVRHGGPPHLIPHQLHGARVLPFDEAAQVMLDDVARGLPADAGADPDGPVLQLHLHEHRAQCVDPPARARGPVLLIDRHRIGDRAVHDPMALLLIVVVRARLAWLNHAGTDLTDPSRPHGAAAGIPLIMWPG